MSAEPNPALHGDRSVDDPTDLRWPDYKVALRGTKSEIKRDDLPSLAAGVAFKIFLALFPSLLAAVAIFSLVTDPEQLDSYLAMLEGVVPEQALDIIQGALTRITDTEAGAAGTLAITGVLGGLWSASSAAATLVKALNRAYEVPEKRGFLMQRGVALAITFALLATIAALIALVVAGPQVRQLIVPSELEGTAVSVLFAVAQVAIVLSLLILLFAFVYWIGPNRERPEWEWLSPGAVVAVVGWLLLSLAFTLYVQNFGDYNETYGTIGGVIVLMLWLQLTMAILLIGAEFNAEVERLKTQYEAVRSGAGMGHIDQSAQEEAPIVAVGAAPAAPAAGAEPSDDAGHAHGARADGNEGAAAGRRGGDIEVTDRAMAFEARVVPTRQIREEQRAGAGAGAAAAVTAVVEKVRKLCDDGPTS